MKNILERISNDYQSRFNGLKDDLESHKDWEILTRVLNLDEMSCFNLFRMTNNSLEDVGTLYSMLVNCLLDDSSFKIDIGSSGIFTHLYVNWGNDDDPRVNENDIIKMVDLLERQAEFVKVNKDAIDNCSIDDRSILREYFKFSKDLEKMMLGLASDDVKKQFKTLKAKKN